MRVLLTNLPLSIPKHQVNSTDTGLAYLAAYLPQEGHALSCLEMNQIREGDELVGGSLVVGIPTFTSRPYYPKRL
jgi:hypothetical protein